MPSIHQARWPDQTDLAQIDLPPDGKYLDVAAAALTAINKRKSELGASVGRVVTRLALTAHGKTATVLRAIMPDVALAARLQGQWTVNESSRVEEAVIEVGDIEIAPRAPARS